MQIGDKYRNKSRPWILYTITGIYNTISNGVTDSEIGCTVEDTNASPGVQKPYGSRVPKDLFLNNTEAVLIQARPIPNVHPMNVMAGLGGNSLDALAASFKASMDSSKASFRAPIAKAPHCDCGGKACGYKDYTRQHFSWCQVYKGD